jgi:hypothetical protein
MKSCPSSVLSFSMVVEVIVQTDPVSARRAQKMEWLSRFHSGRETFLLVAPAKERADRRGRGEGRSKCNLEGRGKKMK